LVFYPIPRERLTAGLTKQEGKEPAWKFLDYAILTTSTRPFCLAAGQEPTLFTHNFIGQGDLFIVSSYLPDNIFPLCFEEVREPSISPIGYDIKYKRVTDTAIISRLTTI
jgi:hypothetical protein